MQNDGGSAYARASLIDVINCVFKNSYANRGGALYLVATGTGSKLFIQGSLFEEVKTGNSSAVKGTGGALYVDGSTAQYSLQVLDCVFRNVSAAILGGAAYLETGKYKAEITFSGCLFESVFSVSGSLVYAQFIDQKKGSLTI